VDVDDEGRGGDVVPTPVGVNREREGRAVAVRRCPHARGGEPHHWQYWVLLNDVVPTPVGVNQSPYTWTTGTGSLSPRPWG